MSNLTATQLIKKAILTEILKWAEDFEIKTVPETPEGIDEAWEIMRESSIGQDTCEEWRGSGIDTPEIPSEWSRYCEYDSVAQLFDNQWVGWQFEHGGSKHHEISAYDWVEDAYFLDCKEELVTVTKRTFAKKN